MPVEVIFLLIGITMGAGSMVMLVYWQAGTIKRLKRTLYDIKNPNDRDINPFDDIPEPWENRRD